MSFHWQVTSVVIIYATSDVVERDEERTFTILDSWMQPTPDREELRNSVSSKQHLTVMVMHHLSCPLTYFLEVEIPWSDICNAFHDIYVSWDPTRFQHQLIFHG